MASGVPRWQWRRSAPCAPHRPTALRPGPRPSRPADERHAGGKARGTPAHRTGHHRGERRRRQPRGRRGGAARSCGQPLLHLGPGRRPASARRWRRRAGPAVPPSRPSGRDRRSPRGAARPPVPSRRTSRPGVRHGRRGSRRCLAPPAGRTTVSAAALTFGRAVVADRAHHHLNGAMAAGQMMPRASWFCSMAAPRMRVTPMP